jgi:heme exporter protein A
VTDATARRAGDGEPAVRLRGVGKRFGWTWALRDVDLVVDRGELLALMGPNGAGKSTLLQILATLLKPTGGDVEVLGRRLSDGTDEIRRRVGFLAAQGYLYGELTARENLRFSSLMSGLVDWEEGAAAALDRVGLERAADLRVRGFSSGMKKRLALARLLLRPLELVLLDEPYASLDTEGVGLVDDLVEEMQEDGRTVILASHQWGRSLQAADRVAVLRRGRVGWTGTPEEHARDAVILTDAGS